MIEITTNRIEPEFFTNIMSSINYDYANLEKIKNIYGFVKNKYPRHILIGLCKLKFSAYTELSKTVDTVHTDRFEKAISNLIAAGIVVPITNKDEKYEFILKFWRRYRVRSPKTTPPAFYKLHPQWKNMIPDLVKFISSYSHDQNTINIDEINKRNEAYKNFCDKEKAHFESQEELKKNSIGQCKECGNYIRQDAERGKHYHKFPIGLICDRCDRRESDKRKWIHTNNKQR